MMRRCGVLLIGLALASCATQGSDPTTGEVQQAITDCYPSGNFPNATMPAQPVWTGQAPPIPNAKEGWVIWQDTSGDWNALLAYPNAGVVAAAFTVKKSDFPKFLGIIGPYGRISVGNPPPPPPPTGTGWEARFGLELQLRAQDVAADAYSASK